MAVGLAFLIFVISSVVTLRVAFAAWRSPGPARIVAVVVLVLFTGFSAWRLNFELHYFDGVDLNPRFTSQDLLGDWKRGDETLSLRADGSVAMSFARRGSWSVGSAPYNERLTLDGLDWKVFTRNGTLCMFPLGDRWDPDEWNLLYVFERQRQP